MLGGNFLFDRRLPGGYAGTGDWDGLNVVFATRIRFFTGNMPLSLSRVAVAQCVG
jgi:hypothetical protein